VGGQAAASASGTASPKSANADASTQGAVSAQ
jgi:hypothetical protein